MTSLYIDRKGIELKLSNEVLICYEDGERVSTIPLAPIDRLILRSDVQLQAKLLAKLGELNIGVVFLSGLKEQPTLFLPQPHNDAARRVRQYQLALDDDFCLAFSQYIVQQKAISQKNTLIQENESLFSQSIQNIDNLIQRIDSQTNLASLRGIEGQMANVYFHTLSQILPQSLHFSGRNRCPPRDPFNAVLSLAYTLLHSEAVFASYTAGLDPYVGFYHGLEFSRESLACDLIEPLRPAVDRWLRACFKENILRVEYFSTTENGCLLGKTGRVQFYQAYENFIFPLRQELMKMSYQLAKLIDENQSLILPQRRAAEMKIPEFKINWKMLVGQYFSQAKEEELLCNI